MSKASKICDLYTRIEDTRASIKMLEEVLREDTTILSISFATFDRDRLYQRGTLLSPAVSKEYCKAAFEGSNSRLTEMEAELERLTGERK